MVIFRINRLLSIFIFLSPFHYSYSVTLTFFLFKTSMFKLSFRYTLLIGITALLLHSCATVDVSSMSAQRYYPGVEEEEPFQSVLLELKPFDQEKIQLDSLQLGDEMFDIPGNNTIIKIRVPLKTETKSAVLFYSRKSTVRTVRIDSITQFESVYLP